MNVINPFETHQGCKEENSAMFMYLADAFKLIRPGDILASMFNKTVCPSGALWWVICMLLNIIPDKGLTRLNTYIKLKVREETNTFRVKENLLIFN